MDYRLLIALKNIRHKALRSWLTILGIVIAAAAIVSLITISQGFSNAIDDAFSKFGSNRVYVMPKGFQGPGAGNQEGLTQKDVDTLEKIPLFQFITPYLVVTQPVDTGKEIITLNSMGIPTSDSQARFDGYDLALLSGRWFSDGATAEAIVGYRVAMTLFDNELKPRDQILIGDKKFKIVGVLEEIGSAEDDRSIYIPLETARDLARNPRGVSFIDAQVKEGVEVERAAAIATAKLKRARNDENFDVMTPAQISGMINDSLGIINIVLLGIASISLLVGAIGIANSMYTSVLERMREIGVMKSVGAGTSDIFIIFLIEASLQGLIGGIVGTAIGFGGAKLLGDISTAAGFPLLIKLNAGIICLGVGFAVLAGAVSGMLPARSAAQMNPIDALRK